MREGGGGAGELVGAEGWRVLGWRMVQGLLNPRLGRSEGGVPPQPIRREARNPLRFVSFGAGGATPLREGAPVAQPHNVPEAPGAPRSGVRGRGEPGRVHPVGAALEVPIPPPPPAHVTTVQAGEVFLHPGLEGEPTREEPQPTAAGPS